MKKRKQCAQRRGNTISQDVRPTNKTEESATQLMWEKNWGFQKARKGELALFFPFPETRNYMNVFVNFRRWCMLFNEKGIKS
jgi:hypothetical protein